MLREKAAVIGVDKILPRHDYFFRVDPEQRYVFTAFSSAGNVARYIDSPKTGKLARSLRYLGYRNFYRKSILFFLFYYCETVSRLPYVNYESTLIARRFVKKIIRSVWEIFSKRRIISRTSKACHRRDCFLGVSKFPS